MSAKCWLKSLQSSVSTQRQVLDHVLLMLSALLFTSKGCVTVDVLNIIPVIAKTDPSKVHIKQLYFSFYIKILNFVIYQYCFT